MGKPDEPKRTKARVKFICPKDGVVARDEIAFLCNTCGRDELVLKDGYYVCPQCLSTGTNFQCMLCDSKEVKVVSGKEPQDHL